MSEVASIAVDLSPPPFSGEPSKGQLIDAKGETHNVYLFGETAAVTEDVFEFLTKLATEQLQQQQQCKELLFKAIQFTMGEIILYSDIQSMQQELVDTPKDRPKEKEVSKQPLSPKPVEKEVAKEKSTPLRHETAKPHLREHNSPTFASVFSLAKAMSVPKREIEKETPKQEHKQTQISEGRKQADLSEVQQQKETKEKDSDGDKQKQGDHQQEEKENPHKHPSPFESFSTSIDKRKKKQGIESVHASTPTGRPKAEVSDSPPPNKSNQILEGVGNIFIRFMALMARILGQAEAEAHNLYLKIKQRTDDIDTLTNFISKINSSKGKIDWSKDEEMKQMIEKVRALGVDIPANKYTWTEDEKKLLKENVQMRKDNMEKMTQLERTDMQRYLQESSQCHQARSNILKLLKEVTDTIIHNFNPR